jgi:hypothetical protein
MNYRFIKKITIIPGLVYLNISKKGISSLTIGWGFLSINFGRKGVNKTLSLHGTGLSFRKYSKYSKANKRKN